MKEIIILGDIELGCGDIYDDFISDKLLIKLILSLAKRKHPVELVLNGDTFDFLKAPYIHKGKERHLTRITPEISMQKLKRMMKAHKKVFEALKTFLKKDQNHIFFLFGNHDQDLYFEEIQQQLRAWLPGNVTFTRTYTHGAIHAEHGNEFDLLLRLAGQPPVKKRRGQKVLNLPWVSKGAIKMQKIKKQHPFLERIKPIQVILQYHPKLKSKVKKQSFQYSVLSFLAHPLEIIEKFSYETGKEYLKRLIRSNFEITRVCERFIDHILDVKPQTTIHVLGHEHINEVRKNGDLVFIHPGTWRDEYELEDKKVLLKKKQYVQVMMEGKKVTWKLITVPVKREILNFNDIVKDEFGFLKKVQEEEA